MQLAKLGRIVDLNAQGPLLAGWRAGCISTESGRLQHVERRWFAYKASRLRVWWDTLRRPTRHRRCEIYFHRHRRNPEFLVLGYVGSDRRASLASLYCGLLALDEIARLMHCQAIVAEVSNSRLSDRLLRRWGWQQHCLHWRGRHFIKRFYGTYPPIPAVWRQRFAPVPGADPPRAVPVAPKALHQK